VFTELIGTISLNIYLAIKTYQVQKEIEEETRLSGATGQLEHLKQKRGNFKKHMKTMLVIASVNSAVYVPFLSLHILGNFLIESTLYQSIMNYIIGPNVGYVIVLPHPFVYGLYFKEIHDPLIKMLKRFLPTHGLQRLPHSK